MRSGAGPEPRLGERPSSGVPFPFPACGARPPSAPLSAFSPRPGGGGRRWRSVGGCPRRPRRAGVGGAGASRCAAVTLDVRRARWIGWEVLGVTSTGGGGHIGSPVMTHPN